MSAPDVTIFVGADDMAMPSADDGANRTMLKPSQVTQLVQWHDKAQTGWRPLRGSWSLS